jgi:hypothetical protein
MLSFISVLVVLISLADARLHPRYHNASELTVNGNLTITRARVVECMRQWVKEKIPYCQCSGGPPSECCGHCPFCGSTRSVCLSIELMLLVLILFIYSLFISSISLLCTYFFTFLCISFLFY